MAARPVAIPSARELLLERAELNSLHVPSQVSAAGGCRLYKCRKGWIALNLARKDDLDLIPALVEEYEVADLPAALSAHLASDLTVRGRVLGLAIANLDEVPASRPVTLTQVGRSRPSPTPLRVLDMSALWAGPLASRLLRIAGCEVVRVESVGREDRLRENDPFHFAALNSGKNEVTLDLRSEQGRQRIRDLVANADIVIEAARPRALMQLGIDAESMVGAQPGLIWITITAHGIAGEAAQWVGFGDDTAVAGGLSRELHETTGRIGFVGDAISDPITGIAAAELALLQARAGKGGRFILSMSALIDEAIAHEKRWNPFEWTASLQRWADSAGMLISEAYRQPEARMPC